MKIPTTTGSAHSLIIPKTAAVLGSVFLASAVMLGCAAHDYRLNVGGPSLSHLATPYDEDDPRHFWATVLATSPDGVQPLRGEPFTEEDRQAVIDEWDGMREAWFANARFVSRSDITTYHRNAVSNVERTDYWHLDGTPYDGRAYVGTGIHQQEAMEHDTTWIVAEIPVNSLQHGQEMLVRISDEFSDVLDGSGGWTRRDTSNRYEYYQQRQRSAGQGAEVFARLQERPLESTDFMYIWSGGHAMVMITNEAEAIENRYNYAAGRAIRPERPVIRVEMIYADRLS